MFFPSAVALALGLSICSAVHGKALPKSQRSTYTCTVIANGDGSDDTQNILDAFTECQTGRTVIFSADTTYYINSVLNTTELKDVDIEIHGKLLWSNDTDYWLDNSMPVGYQNQSTVWFLGGSGLNVNGFGTGTFDGNGQTWYDLVKGVSNYPDRPMALTIWGAQDSTFSGLKFVQSQMWTMAIMHSQNVTLENIYVNSTSSNGNPARNTDGADVLFSDNIVMRGWEVDNGDDAIALKANSTNVIIEDSVFHTGQGLAFGSIGQYPGVYETIENVVARNITVEGTKYAVYFKTWTGEQVNYPPNGGGGGLGHINNITVEDFTLDGVRSTAAFITQCTTFSGTAGDCNSSEFVLENITIQGFTGAINSSYVATMQCSADSGGCQNIEFEDIDLTDGSSGGTVDDYKCSNVKSTVGFEC